MAFPPGEEVVVPIPREAVAANDASKAAARKRRWLVAASTTCAADADAVAVLPAEEVLPPVATASTSS